MDKEVAGEGVRNQEDTDVALISKTLPNPAKVESLIPPQNDRKRPREVADEVAHVSTDRPGKRLRSSSSPYPVKREPSREAASPLSASQRTQISHWAVQHTWPRSFSEQGTMQNIVQNPAQNVVQDSHPKLARQKSSALLRRKRSETSLITSETASDQRPREEKSAPYRSKDYEISLEAIGHSYMDPSELGITDASATLCLNLLAKRYDTPKDTLFRDDVFPKACKNLRGKNEARVIQDIARLLVPSPEALAAFGAKPFDVLVESVNEGWNNSIPITSTRPQPDFAVGFRRSMFSEDQLRKIEPFLGGAAFQSFFKATASMYFPFLTCEVKCGALGLDIADRQNAHSQTVAARGIVEFFRLAKKENELHRRILTFSISHDHRGVRIYGVYPIIDGSNTEFYRYSIHSFDITALNGRDKWASYHFVSAVYDHSLTLLKDLRSVVDGLPADFLLQSVNAVEPTEQVVSGPSGLSQNLENHSPAAVEDSLVGDNDIQQVTPITSTQPETPQSKRNKGSRSG
ncbi:MAG: hypothetical protein Q9166_005603 [cf. Caloplaca sp. 2 TL-2023]